MLNPMMFSPQVKLEFVSKQLEYNRIVETQDCVTSRCCEQKRGEAKTDLWLNEWWLFRKGE